MLLHGPSRWEYYKIGCCCTDLPGGTRQDREDRRILKSAEINAYKGNVYRFVRGLENEGGNVAFAIHLHNDQRKPY